MARGNRKGNKPTEAQVRMLHGIVAGVTGDCKTKQIAEDNELSSFYTRPLYYGTSLQNDTIAELHKNDYLKKKAKWER